MPADRRTRGPRRAARLVAETLEARRLMAVITVDSAGDVDGNGGEDGGNFLTLRQAIEIANGSLEVGRLSTLQAALIVGPLATPNVIDFAIPGAGPFTIRPASALPAITRPVVIDGYSQPHARFGAGGLGSGGGPVIEIALDGSLAPGANGLVLQGGASVVQGLAIGGFLRTDPGASLTGNGILLESHAGDVVRANFLGTDASGIVGLPNSTGLTDGNRIGDEPTAPNTIGGTGPADGNVISGNLGAGVALEGTYGVGIIRTAKDLIQGNRIGTDATGLVALPNGGAGVADSGGGSTIGGTAAGAGNVISGNLGDGISTSGNFGHVGIFVIPSGSNTLVQGNLIGTDAAGFAPLPNRGNGIASDGGQVTIGGTAAGAANVIAGNLGAGVKVVGVSDTGASPIPHYTISRNSIRENAGSGIVYDPPGLLGVSPTPTLQALISSKLGSFLSGSLVGIPLASYTVEFFTSPHPDASFAGQGALYLGSVTATTNIEGLAGFSFSTPSTLIGQYVSATATQVPPLYSGSSQGTSPFALDLLGLPIVTTNTLLGVNPSPGQPFALTSVVTSAGTAPTGEVEFNVDGREVGRTTLGANGVASVVVGPLGPGYHALTSTYLGDATHAAAPSETLAVSVLAPVAVSLVAPPPVVIKGQPITFLAEVNTPGGVPGGYLAFLDGGQEIGLAKLDARGLATFTTTGLAPGAHAITAYYLGDIGHSFGLSGGSAVAVFDALAFGGPSVTSAGFAGPQTVAIAFNRGLLPGPAVDPANYAIIGPGHRKIALLSAAYDPTTATVTLTTAQKLDPGQAYQLTINGQKPGRVVDVFGIPLNGQPKGKPGHNYSGRIQHAKAPAKVSHPAPPPPPDPRTRSRVPAKKH